MSIEAKATLLNALEHDLSTRITAADMSIVLSIVSDRLAAYSLDQVAQGEEQPDDLLDAYMAAMQIQGRSRKTLERYGYIIRRMMQSVRVPTRQIDTTMQYVVLDKSEVAHSYRKYAWSPIVAL